MFKIFIFGFIATILGAPRTSNDEVKVIDMVRIRNDDSSYKFSYELSDGQIRSEEGVRKQIGNESPIVTQGGYSFIAPNGQTHWVQFLADEIGYHSRTGIGRSPPNDKRTATQIINSEKFRYETSDDEDDLGSGFKPYPAKVEFSADGDSQKFRYQTSDDEDDLGSGIMP